MEILLESERHTAKLAESISAFLSPVDCLTLAGDLGAGKTTLMRYLIGAMALEKTDVISPSFLLMQEYDVRIRKPGSGNPDTKLWHIDGYRLNDAGEIPELGLEELIENGIVAIEWPERFAGYLPQDRLEIELEFVASDKRKITITGRGAHERTATQIGERFHEHA